MPPTFINKASLLATLFPLLPVFPGIKRNVRESSRTKKSTRPQSSGNKVSFFRRHVVPKTRRLFLLSKCHPFFRAARASIYFQGRVHTRVRSRIKKKRRCRQGSREKRRSRTQLSRTVTAGELVYRRPPRVPTGFCPPTILRDAICNKLTIRRLKIFVLFALGNVGF